MQIIVSPAKDMGTVEKEFSSLPHFLQETETLKNVLNTLEEEKLKEVWQCSEKLFRLNRERLQAMDLKNDLTPSLYAYQGRAFQFMQVSSLSEESIAFLNAHLFILSGFYGALRPLDGITPYRLEMKTGIPGIGSLYSFWGDKLYQYITKKDHWIVNLASKEYERAVAPYLQEKDHMITCVFLEESKGKMVQRSANAKAARGAMVHYIAQNRISDPADLKGYDRGYVYQKPLSDEEHFVFLKQN